MPECLPVPRVPSGLQEVLGWGQRRSSFSVSSAPNSAPGSPPSHTLQRSPQVWVPLACLYPLWRPKPEARALPRPTSPHCHPLPNPVTLLPPNLPDPIFFSPPLLPKPRLSPRQLSLRLLQKPPRCPDTCYIRDKSWGHYAKWNKPVTKRQILHNSTFVK